jgi:DNA-binding transcriptional LysR family regulator
MGRGTPLTGLSELNAVVVVAEHRSFRKAATVLGISPSTLSHTISTLEGRMGVRLFNRTTRSVAPSEACEEFLAQLRPALEQINNAMAGVSQYRDTPSGTIRINASEGAAQMVLEPIVLEFLRRYPDMQVDIVTEGRLVDIVAEGFDVGIRAVEHLPLDMVAVSCTPPIRFVVVGSPSYFDTHPVPQTVDDLHQHQCIRSRLASGALYRWEFERNGTQVDFEPVGSLTLDNSNLMRRAAILGAGLAWVDEWSVREALAQGSLLRILEEWSPQLPPLSVYYPGHRHLSAGMRAFISLVREVSQASFSESHF